MSSQDKKRSNQVEADVVSIAPTESNKDDLQRFTATGRPMPAQQYSGLDSMPIGCSVFGGTSGPGNTLPWRFRDTDYINIPIPTADLEDPSAASNPIVPERRKSFLGKLRGGGNKAAPLKMVRMTREEYLKYWAKDENGTYIGTEPEGEGRRRLQDSSHGETLVEGNKDIPRQSVGDYLGVHNVVRAMGQGAMGVVPP